MSNFYCLSSSAVFAAYPGSSALGELKFSQIRNMWKVYAACGSRQLGEYRVPLPVYHHLEFILCNIIVSGCVFHENIIISTIWKNLACQLSNLCTYLLTLNRDAWPAVVHKTLSIWKRLWTRRLHAVAHWAKPRDKGKLRGVLLLVVSDLVYQVFVRLDSTQNLLFLPDLMTILLNSSVPSC